MHTRIQRTFRYMTYIFTRRDGGCDPFFILCVRSEDDLHEYEIFRSRDHYKPTHVRGEASIALPVGPNTVRLSVCLCVCVCCVCAYLSVCARICKLYAFEWLSCVQFVHVCPCLSKSLYVYPYLSISVHVCPYLSKSLYVCPYLSISVHICPYLSMSVHISLSLSTSVHICPYLSISVHICPYLSKSLYVCPYLSISVHVCPYLSMSVLSLQVSLRLSVHVRLCVCL